MKKIAALWIGKDKKGRNKISGQWDRDFNPVKDFQPGGNFHILPNNFKDSDKHPDYQLLIPDDDPPVTVDVAQPETTDDIPF